MVGRGGDDGRGEGGCRFSAHWRRAFFSTTKSCGTNTLSAQFHEPGRSEVVRLLAYAPQFCAGMSLTRLYRTS